MKIRLLTKQDIPTWQALSEDYDAYVKELAPNLIQWYEGNEHGMSFRKYIISKREQSEAFMAVNLSENKCLGIVAISKRHNRITFFAINHEAPNYFSVGNLLIDFALEQLSILQDIFVNVLKSKTKHIEKQRELLKAKGFVYQAGELENEVPVDQMVLKRYS